MRLLTRRKARAATKVAALGYASAPPDAPLDGPEIQGQRNAIEDACWLLQLDLVDFVSESEPDGTPGRPGLEDALRRIDEGAAACLVVSELERLSREVGELSALVDRLERGGVRLVALDVGLDTATPSGRLAIGARDEAFAGRASIVPGSRRVRQRAPTTSAATSRQPRPEGPLRRAL